MAVHEGLLQRVQRLSLRQALDRRDAAALGLQRQHTAALDRIAIHQHGAGAALGGVAAGVGTGQREWAAQQVYQQGGWRHFQGHGTAVDLKVQGDHAKSPG